MAAAQEPVARVVVKWLLITAAAIAAPAYAGERIKNWYGDPFFQVRTAVLRCPEPLGPRTTEAEMRAAAHARAERGTRCWLAGQCTKPNAYLYDAAIAEAVRDRFARSRALHDASLWVTVQRRVVFIEGCAPARAAGRTIAQLLQGIPDVDLVVVEVARDPAQPMPFRVLPSGAPD